MHKQPIIKSIKDKITLVLLAMVIMFGLVFSIYTIDNTMHLSTMWIYFILFSILYVVLTMYECLPLLKKLHNKAMGFGILAGTQFFVIVAVFLVFYFKLLEPTQRFIVPWGIGVYLFALLTKIVFAGFVDKSKRSTL